MKRNVVDKINQLQIIKNIVFRIISFFSCFENNLVKIWNKPRLVKESNYVITLDRIASKKGGLGLIEKILNHEGMVEQVDEWKELSIVGDDFNKDDIITSGQLSEKYKFLPIDTKYFKDLALEILGLFDNLDEELDGWLIKSENYQALNNILPKFKEKIQTIYIDPPFNKEQEADYLYNVKYKNFTWASMLENRLRLARDLLNDRGSIFVRCDYNGNWIVRPLMNEVFGEENFRNEIIIGRKRQSIGTSNKFEVENEYILFYSSTPNYLFKESYIGKHEEDLKWTGFLKQEERNPPERIFLEKKLYPPKGQHFSLIQEKVDKLLKEHYLRLRCKICSSVYYFDKSDSREQFSRKISLDDPRYKVKGGSIYGVRQIDRCLKCSGDDWKVEYMPFEFKKLGNNWLDVSSYSNTQGFKTENSEILLKRVIECTSNEGDLVMDFFLGSGTTVAVAHKLSRKWIGIEVGDHFYTVILPRMKKVLYYDKTGISKEKDVKEKYNEKKAGGFFQYYELEQYEDLLKNINIGGVI